MFTARETTSATVTIEMSDCTVIATFAHRDMGITSVGQNADALVLSHIHISDPTRRTPI
jgi:hypothetical protein